MLKGVGFGLRAGSIFVLMFVAVLSSCAIKRPKESVVQQSYAPQSIGMADPQVIDALQRKKKEQRNEKVKGRNDSITVFKKFLSVALSRSEYPRWLDSLYKLHDYRPFLQDQTFGGLVDHLRKTTLHGLDTNYFYLNEIGPRILELSQAQAKSETLKYPEKVQLELLMAAALLKYSRAMQYGLIAPDSLDKNYFLKTQAPDSSKIMRVFNAPDLLFFLDSIQPSSEAYRSLQKALQADAGAINRNKEDAAQTIKLNLERLRWQNKPDAQKYVLVNIPDYTLDVMEKGVSTLQMKVCVGEGRKESDPEGSRETPQLNSMIYSVQVNPIWNIPASIARKEISRYAARNPNYLSNNDIDVYQDGKRISSKNIDWSIVDVSQYTFKQRPGEQNSLGKIKFIFNNNSSVYLHDTPVRSAFKKKVRAISHGCVRVEKPMDLALALFGPGKTFDQIKTAMERSYPRAKYIGLPVKIPVYLTYTTAWVDDKGLLQIRNDIYGLDNLLYNEMKSRQMITE
ncbi:L,D-transpeptidase family protein [Pedobacter gandavensis]|uniref:L,D-transpeptidase family protein n=1 Tax=Pedobacter gandavensis TaxID=2679963 RepID=A0ABR6ETU7_9SPHI|nr:L,D-transpeptidase family protein [Pedobacter gandavensis]MBB2148697.1 L,D-transpeptidase family protein [Pedobacter gandavensis]